MDSHSHGFKIGDRVHAKQRTGFPVGVVARLLTNGYLVVNWDNKLVETIPASELELAPPID